MTMPGPSGVSIDADALARALDVDPADPGVRELAQQVLPDAAGPPRR